MELRHLRYFVAVAEHLNFGRAAQALHTAQPSLSQQIRQLERELGVRLFDRNKRYVELTEEGRRALGEARAILDRVGTLGETMRHAAGMPSGPLRIGSIVASTIGVLPLLLPSYRDRFPLVSFTIETLPIDEQLRALVERRIDVAILRGPIHDARIASRAIGSEELFAALNPAHRLAGRRRVPIAELNGSHLITVQTERAGGFVTEMTRALAGYGVRFSEITETPDLETCIALVACGMGVSVVSSIARSFVLRNIVYRPLSPRTTIETLALAWRRDREDLPVIRSFIEHVRREKLILAD
jgi:DNA-binding transcriptional LysR family regulator